MKVQTDVGRELFAPVNLAEGEKREFVILAGKLTDRQREFCRHYAPAFCDDPHDNGVEAALAAGYSAKDVERQARANRRNRKVMRVVGWLSGRREAAAALVKKSDEGDDAGVATRNEAEMILTDILRYGSEQAKLQAARLLIELRGWKPKTESDGSDEGSFLSRLIKDVQDQNAAALKRRQPADGDPLHA